MGRGDAPMGSSARTNRCRMMFSDSLKCDSTCRVWLPSASNLVRW